MMASKQTWQIIWYAPHQAHRLTRLSRILRSLDLLQVAGLDATPLQLGAGPYPLSSVMSPAPPSSCAFPHFYIHNSSITVNDGSGIHRPPVIKMGLPIGRYSVQAHLGAKLVSRQQQCSVNYK